MTLKPVPANRLHKALLLSRLLMGLVVVAVSLCARGHPSKTDAIDDFCAAIRREFVEAAPRYFSGPNPWVELDSLPDEYADAALASVYSEGSRIAWVVLAMAGPGNAWFETTDYFFDEAGLIRKRERLFEHPDANVLIKEVTYFSKGKVLKTSYHHAPRNGGKENWDSLYDPNAPDYTSTADLPVSFQPNGLKQLTRLSNTLVCVLSVLQQYCYPCYTSPKW